MLACIAQKRTGSLLLTLRLDSVGMNDHTTQGTLYPNLLQVIIAPHYSVTHSLLWIKAETKSTFTFCCYFDGLMEMLALF